MPLLPPLNTLSLFLFLLIFIHGTYSATPNPCSSSYQCGDITVEYPFSFSDSYTPDSPKNSSCGYPGLRIYCHDDKYPILFLSSYNYTVTNISYTANTISLVDTDILLQNSSTPKVRHNVSLTPNISLNYTEQVVNLTFFTNCTTFGASYNTYEIPAVGIPGNNSYVFPTTSIPPDKYYEWVDKCDQVVVAPALGLLLQPLWNLSTSYGSVLLHGFQLEWSDPSEDSEDCRRCEERGGQCGYNVTSYSTYIPTCFCTGNCGTDKKSRHDIGVVVGVSVTGAVVFLLLVFSFLFIRKKRQDSSRSILLKQSRSISSFEPPYMHSKDLPDIESTKITHVFPYQELEEATNGFDSKEEIGDGGFGTVYKGKLRDGRIVAIKRLYEHNCRRMEQFMNEVQILSLLRHPNLVALYGCTSRHSRELLLVYEFIPNGTVADHLHGSHASERALTWNRRLSIAIEAADALAYLHAVDPPIVHRDVKTSNMLVDAVYHVKVADFGLSRLFPVAVTHVSTAPQGTPGYVDPEYHKCYQLTDKSDVYSFGVVLVELISSMQAVDVTRHRDEINLANMAIKRIQQCELDKLVDPWLGFGTDAATKKMITMVAELAFRCLQPDGDMRPPMREVLDVLLDIRKKGENLEMANGALENEERTADHKGLLKNSVIMPSSPDSVINKWVSRSTTPNTSE
ncbi:Protein kinase family protein [Rhynchospora pubera]|uniref:Protein kinase family protein n=1 Tax=Rhynchospora pubera TaxID=906938 RepID=A0AAV8HYY3_9POAL|nr:Protein kinase family protein [Rhynchospora pubera]